MERSEVDGHTEALRQAQARTTAVGDLLNAEILEEAAALDPIPGLRSCNCQDRDGDTRQDQP